MSLVNYFTQRSFRETVKKLLARISHWFCTPLDREATRKIKQLECLDRQNGFVLRSLKINGVEGELKIKVVYPSSNLFRLSVSEQQKVCVLSSGGISQGQQILSTGFDGQQAYNILGFLTSKLKKPLSLQGTIICNWSQQFLTYGDFVLQLLPELCLIKSHLPEHEWQSAYFLFRRPPQYLISYLKLLGCSENQIIDVKGKCVRIKPTSQLYFREKDPMWFLCAPPKLLDRTRAYLLEKLPVKIRYEKIIFVERLNGYRQALGLNPQTRARLMKLGVSFFDPCQFTIAEQIDVFRNASIVIGVHGAGLANIMWCREGTKIIEIFHPKFAAWCYAILANQLNLEYYCLGRAPGSMNVNYREADVDINWQHLIELIKHLLDSQ